MGEQIILAQQPAQARADLPQNFVLRVVTERNIELLEPVQIDQQQHIPPQQLRASAIFASSWSRRCGRLPGPVSGSVTAWSSLSRKRSPDGARGPRHPDQDRADRQAHRRSTDPHELPGREQPQRDQPKP